MIPSNSDCFIPSTQWQEAPSWAQVPPGYELQRHRRTLAYLYRWKEPVPGPETVIDKRTGKPQSFGAEKQESRANPPYVQVVTPEEERQYTSCKIPQNNGQEGIFDDKTVIDDYTCLQELNSLPVDFPLDCLPEKVRQMVLATAESINVHPNLPASAILGVCSAACGKGLFLCSGPDQRLRPNLFIMGAAISGAGKSEGARPIVAPLRNYELKKRSYFDEITRPEVESQKRVLEKKLKNIESRLNSKSEQPGDLLDKEAKEALRKEHQEGVTRLYKLIDQLQSPTMMAEDVTQEEAAILLSQNNEQLFLYSSDAAKAVANLEGLYNKLKVPDENLFVKGYSGDSHIVNRVSRPAIFLASPCISLLWYLQPDLVTRILENPRLRVGGFFARLLICNTRLEPTEIPPDSRPIPPEVRETYNTLVESLLEQYWEARREFEIPVDPKARELIRSYHNELVPIRKAELSDVNSFVARWHEQAWRISAAIHAMEFGPLSHDHRLTPELMQMAIQLNKWFTSQQLQILAQARHSMLRQSALKLKDLLSESYPSGVPLRDLQHSHNWSPDEVNKLVKSFPAWFDLFNATPPGKRGRPSLSIRLNHQFI